MALSKDSQRGQHEMDTTTIALAAISAATTVCLAYIAARYRITTKNNNKEKK